MNSRVVFTIALVACSLTQALSQTPIAPPHISLSGSAEIKVAPDEVYLQVGVETRHENLADAKQRND